MIKPQSAASILQYLRITTIAIPRENVSRHTFYEECLKAAQIGAWKTKAQHILGYTPEQTAYIGTRRELFNRTMNACPFR